MLWNTQSKQIDKTKYSVFIRINSYFNSSFHKTNLFVNNQASKFVHFQFNNLCIILLPVYSTNSMMKSETMSKGRIDINDMVKRSIGMSFAAEKTIQMIFKVQQSE